MNFAAKQNQFLFLSPLNRISAAVLTILVTVVLSGCSPSEPQISGEAPSIRRLSEAQYRNIISDVFGSEIVVSGRFDPLLRTDGLLAIGAWNASITPAGLIQYEAMARSISSQVVNENNRRVLVSCKPVMETMFDKTCATQFLSKVGRLLLRRPLTEDELKARIAVTKTATQKLDNFYDGLAFGLTTLLLSPEFLYIIDDVEPDPNRTGEVRLNAFSKASRLSFLLWNTAPDETLLLAAEQGKLHSKEELIDQADRMLASPRFKTGVRAFFSDMLGFDGFEVLEKDSIIYPAFGLATAQDAKEQTLRTITNLLVSQNADYRDLFTTRKTFMSRPLGRVYQTRVAVPEGGWEPFEIEQDNPRVGIQGHISFLSLNAHPGRSSPTLRGKAVRTFLLCQNVPDPPADVDFNQFSDPNSPNKTARERLTVHSTSPACAGCHRITDPIGLALENFDGAGQFRLVENDAPIDPSGDLDGLDFSDAVGLGAALHDNPATTACLVTQLYAYASGRSTSRNDDWMTYLENSFSFSGYRFTELIRSIATSDALYAVSKPIDLPTEVQSAMID